MKKRYTKSINHWIFQSHTVSSKGLGLYRIIASLFLLFFLIPGMGFEHYQYLSSLPADFFNPPPGPMRLFNSFPPFIVFQLVYTLVVISVLAMLIGYKTKVTSILSGVFILILQGFVYSIGKVNHEILVPLVPILMSFTNWGASLSIDAFHPHKEKAQVESWPLVLLSVFIGFMMFTAGMPKIFGGWLNPSTQAVKSHLLNQFFVNERGAFLAGYAIQIQSELFWEMLDWITIIFEIGFLVSVFKAKWFRFFLVMAVFFHFSTEMLLNIAFLTNFLAYAAFLKWNKIYHFNKSLFKRLTDVDEHEAGMKAVLWFVALVILLFSILKWISVQDFFLVHSDLTLHESIFLFFAVFVASYNSIKYLMDSKKKRSGL